MCLQLKPAGLDDIGSFANKTFYTGIDVLDLYLEWMLSPDQLMDVGIAFVPHGQKQSVYSALLDGKPFTPPKPKPPMLADDHALPKTPRPETLDEPRAIADIDVEPGDPDDDDVDMPHEQMTLEEYLSFVIPTPPTPQAPTPRDGMPPTPNPSSPRGTALPSPEQSLLEFAGRGGPPPPPPSWAQVQGEPWGPFRLLRKRVFGTDGVLVTCYFHGLPSAAGRATVGSLSRTVSSRA